MHQTLPLPRARASFGRGASSGARELTLEEYGRVRKMNDVYAPAPPVQFRRARL